MVLKKSLHPYFLHFKAVFFFLYFFYIFFRFSVFLGQLLRYGHIVPTPKLNRIKNGLSVLFAKKYGFYVFNTKYGFSVFNTKYGNTEKKFVPTPKLNRVKNGLSVLFENKIRVFRIQY